MLSDIFKNKHAAGEAGDAAAQAPPEIMPDYILIAIVFILTSIGVIMVFSASGISSYTKWNDGTYFLRKEVISVLIAICGMLFTSFFDYRYYQKIAPWIYGFCCLLLMLVLIPGIGKEVNGARRWMRLGFIDFQVSDLAKIGLIMFVADLIARAKERITEIRIFAIIFGVVCFVAFLVLLEPDFGMAAVMTGITLGMLFIAGSRLIHVAGIMAMAIPAGYALILFEPYRLRRLMAFMDPWKDAQDSGFHVIQSMIAIASGGGFGRGLGMGNAKRFFLPEQHTDFIFSVMLEETGMIGMLLLILLFVYLGYRGFRIAMQSRDPFATYLAFGITLNILMQAVVNMGVAVGMLPVTGLTLPFVSFGGASLITTYLGIGILVNISIRDALRRKKLYEKHSTRGWGYGRTSLSGRGSRAPHHAS